MPNFNFFNSSTGTLNLFGNDRGIIPRVGINFGNSGLGRTLGAIGRFFSSGRLQKGHPGSSGQIVGRGVRRLNNLRLSRNSIDAIQQTKHSYGAAKYENKIHPAGFTPPYLFLFKQDGSESETWKPYLQFGSGIEMKKTQGMLPLVPELFNLQEKVKILAIEDSTKIRSKILKDIDPRTKIFTFGNTDKFEHLKIDNVFRTISDNNFEQYAGLQSPSSIGLPLASFTEVVDNEDPTILGFDIVLNEITSPLLNGAIVDFINNYEDNFPELVSRRKIYTEFIDKFKEFFNIISSVEDSTAKKNHYIYSITGLSNLGHVKGSTTGGDSSGGTKIFTDFPTAKITLTINEDVSQSISYLSYLYNLLSRSRIQGRRIIPQNLLRFNCSIIISEIRNYNRVVKEVENQQPTYKILHDMISKKEYNLYECEFFFNTLTHTDTLTIGGNDSSARTTVSGVAISFDYKFVSSEFHKFEFNPKNPKKDLGTKQQLYFTRKKYNDEYFNPMSLTTLDTSRAIISNSDLLANNTDGSLKKLSSISYVDDILKNIEIDRIPKSPFAMSSPPDSILTRAKRKALRDTLVGGLVRNLVGDVLRAGAGAINRQISSRFNLVNKAINEKLNKIGLSISLNTIQNPRNIYNPGGQLKNELQNAIRGFVGRATGRFFSKPVNTSEANNGFLPRRADGGLRVTRLYREQPLRSINRLRASRITQPRNIYVRRVGPFSGGSNPRQISPIRRSAQSNRLSREAPFIMNLAPTTNPSQNQ